ncbi:VRR-NUC domain-containing protein [Rhizobium leguminosarum]|uniref:VRR-NUC domain-containing protein n=1 Tax=Rhizobium leguminosarum TaxID=384 RepID=UPI001A91768F|nr:VRR-NUC domain-containing protein [Rhizobium leguminosarum]MBY5553736.1 VRR-NUC domain-containing protein [Rhizobium leguminosarum]QSW24851.1 VRR-NUC domain-containing protein [Rhizobium leguminosarum]
MTKTTTQTTRIAGKRVRIVTRVTATGTSVKVTDAAPKEWELQAAQVRALRAMPEYGKQFLLAGDQNSAKRGPRAQMEATAAGMTPGEADLRIYLAGGQLRMIENKVGKGRLSPAQIDRHAALARLGHPVEVVRADACAGAAVRAVELVRGWLAEASNKPLDKFVECT